MRKLREIHRDERGGPMAEYLPLLALIALTIIFAIAFFGFAVRDALGGECPEGQWDLVSVGFVDPKRQHEAIEVDKDGNGFVCVKSEANTGRGLPGEGNTGRNSNLKDNL